MDFEPLRIEQLDSARLAARVLDAHGAVIPGATIAFESNNPSIATVSSSGLVTSKGPAGSASITLRAGSISRVVTALIAPVPTKVSVPQFIVNMAQLDTVHVDIAVLDRIGAPIPDAPIELIPNAPGIVDFRPGGVIISLGPSSGVSIIARSGTLSAQFGLIVSRVDVRLLVEPSAVTLAPGQHIELIVRSVDRIGAVSQPNASFGYYWLTSDPAIVTVSERAVLSAGVIPGRAQIRVQSVLPSDPAVFVVDVTTTSTPAVRPGVFASESFQGSVSGLAIDAAGDVAVSLYPSIPLETGAVVRTAFPNGTRPHLITAPGRGFAVAMNREGTRAYTALASGGVATFDLTGGTHIETVGAPFVGFDIALSHDQGTAYLASSGIVTVDPTRQGSASHIATGPPTLDMVVHPRDPWVYVPGFEKRILEVDPIHPALRREFVTNTSFTSGSAGMAVRSDGSELYFSDGFTRTIGVVDLATGETSVLMTVPCGGRLASLAGTDLLYVVCTFPGKVLVVNRRSRVVEREIELGGRPDRIVSALNGQFVVISNLEGWVDFVR